MAQSKSGTAKKVKAPAIKKSNKGFKKAAPKKANTSLKENLNKDAATNTNAPVVDQAIGKKSTAGTVVSTKHSTGKWLVTEKKVDGTLKSQYLADEPKGEVIR